MEAAAHSKPVKDKALSCIRPFVILLFFFEASLTSSPHTPYNVTWTISSLGGEVINQTSQVAPPSVYFPEIRFDLCKLMNGDESCSMFGRGIYACPAGTNHLKCGGPEVGFCREWGCETTGTVYWRPQSGDSPITLSELPGWGPISSQGYCINGTRGRCHPVTLNFTAKGRQEPWDSPKTWGVYLYVPGPHYDPFTIFLLSRKITSASQTVSVGPNKVLSGEPQLAPSPVP